MRPTVGQILSGLAVTSVATAMLAAPERVLVTPQERSVPGFELRLADEGTVVRAEPVRPARVAGKQRRAVVRHPARQAQPIAIAVSFSLPARPQQPPPSRGVPPKPKPTPPPPATAPPPTDPPPAAPPPPAPPPVAPPPAAPPPIPVVVANPGENDPDRPGKPKKERAATRDEGNESRTSDDSRHRGRGHERKKKHRGADD